MDRLRPQGGVEAPLRTFFEAGCISGLVGSSVPARVLLPHDMVLIRLVPDAALRFVNTPIELLKIRQQSSLHTPPSTWSLLRGIYAFEGGIRGVYRGFTPCWLRDIGFGPYFLTYEVILRALDPGRRVWEGEDILEETEDEIARRGGRGWGAVAIAGAAAGVVSWTVSSKMGLQSNGRRAADPVISALDRAGDVPV